MATQAMRSAAHLIAPLDHQIDQTSRGVDTRPGTGKEPGQALLQQQG